MLPVICEMSASKVATVDATEEDFNLTMSAGKLYLLMSNTACWIKQGTAPIAATAGDGSVFVPANTPFLILGNNGPNLSILRDAADGKASLTPCQVA